MRRLLPPALQALHTTPTTAPILHRSLISVSGPDATQWLNGILASIVPNPPNGHFYSAFLNAQGRILHDVFVYTQPSSQGYLIEYDSRALSEDVPPLFLALRKFILRAKVKLRDVSDEYDVWAAWGSKAESHWETERRWSWADRSNISAPLWDTTVFPEDASPWGKEDIVLRDRRAVGLGHRLLVKKGERPKEATTHDVGNFDSYTTHRYLNGVPEGSVELPPGQAFPMESNLDFMGAIDFRKGCYVGQELTVRTYHTGVIRKRIFPIAIDNPNQSLTETLESPSPISYPSIHLALPEDPSNGASSATSSARKPRGTSKLLGSVNGVGLALLRADHVEAADRGIYHFVIGEGEDQRRITHWYPHWWPTPHSRITCTT